MSENIHLNPRPVRCFNCNHRMFDAHIVTGKIVQKCSKCGAMNTIEARSQKDKSLLKKAAAQG